jgi:hypothetical protein
MKKNKNVYLTIIVVLIISGLLSFSYYLNNKGVEASNLPKEALRDPVVREAYEYVSENPEFLDYIPCYCNCYRLGHKNIKNCFVSKFKSDGNVVFDHHGVDCAICYHTVLDSKKLFQQGKSVQTIRDFIDNKYSQYGMGTSTPEP